MLVAILTLWPGAEWSVSKYRNRQPLVIKLMLVPYHYQTKTSENSTHALLDSVNEAGGEAELQRSEAFFPITSEWDATHPKNL